MKKYITPTFLALALAGLPQQGAAKVADLLPLPNNVVKTEGGAPFALNRSVKITDATDNAALKRFLAANNCTTADDAAATVTVELVESINGTYDYELANFPNEAYKLTVTENEIKITAVTATGVTRAAQTLTQLAEGYDAEGETAQLEAVSITDYPAFKLRGWMQDVGRSFLSIDELKREIDLYSRFKVNVFHWHLTEKLAWRFEVKQYPALTQSENMVRYPGQYYTQEQCKELEAYAAERGVMVIPEIDMPGHSAVFTTAMGFDMQSTEGRAALKKILDEVNTTFPLAPYIHIGGDEVALQDGFLEEMADYVRTTLGRKVVVWNPLQNKSVTSSMADMTQMWSTAGKKISGMPNIDCRYNYINHFDVYADLVGIYKSNIYYADKGDSEIAGSISAAWNDTKVPTETDIIAQNNQYANVLATAERAWIGGGKQYIEQGGTTLPNTGEEYEAFADFERRLLFHKAHSLKDVPMPYVKQSNVRWRITDPFPNGGTVTATFPPETDTSDILPTKFTYNNATYRAKLATGAGIYLRHIWHPTVPSFLASPAANQTVYAWTYVYSPKAQDCAAQVEFYTYSRSGNEYAPKKGAWDRRGSQIWLNGDEIPAPEWQQTDTDIPQDDAVKGLTNENLTARQPVALHLNEGWNKVFIKLPHVNSGGTKRDKWQFTFVLTDTEGRNALDGITYSPDKSFDAPVDDTTPQVSTADDTYYYQLTSKRGGRYLTSRGVGAVLYGDASATELSEWKLEQRTDGTLNIVNRSDNSYIAPTAATNSALSTSAAEPANGWTLSAASTSGYYIITSNGVQFNQTNAGLKWIIYNWGNGINTTDEGCQYSFLLTDHVKKSTAIAAATATEADKTIRVENGTVRCALPYRLYAANGKSLSPGTKLNPGTYIVRTAREAVKVTVR